MIILITPIDVYVTAGHQVTPIVQPTTPAPLRLIISFLLCGARLTQVYEWLIYG